jgi:hypothetical protein
VNAVTEGLKGHNFFIRQSISIFFFGCYSNILLVITGAKGIALLRSIISRVTAGCVIKASQLMMYREIIAVCSEIHTKYINTVCRQNVEFVNVKLVVHIVTTGL